MRARFVAGLLSLGVALGALCGLYFPSPSPGAVEATLVDDYIRVVGELYAKGESLEAAESRLEAVRPYGASATLQPLAARNLTSPGANDGGGTLLAASGRGSVRTPPPEVAGVATSVPEVEHDFPRSGKVSPTKGDASLRTEPALSASVVRVIPRGSEVVLLGLEHGQAVEGADDRWYHVRHADASGYVYFALLEPLP